MAVAVPLGWSGDSVPGLLTTACKGQWLITFVDSLFQPVQLSWLQTHPTDREVFDSDL
jgi:hypothetical protein